MAKKKQESNNGAENAPEVTKEAVNVEAAKTEATTVTEAPKGKSKAAVYTVKIAFKDSKQYRKDGKINEYTVGADVSDLDPERLENLVSRGIVEKQ